MAWIAAPKRLGLRQLPVGDEQGPVGKPESPLCIDPYTQGGVVVPAHLPAKCLERWRVYSRIEKLIVTGSQQPFCKPCGGAAAETVDGIGLLELCAGNAAPERPAGMADKDQAGWMTNRQF